MSLYSKIMECGGYLNKNVRGISKPVLIAGILFPIAVAANLFPLYLQRQAKIEEKCVEEYRTVLERMVKGNADTNGDSYVDDRERENFFREYFFEVPLNKELTKKFYELPPNYKFSGNDWRDVRCTISKEGTMVIEKKVENSPHGYLVWVAVQKPPTPKDQLEILYLVKEMRNL